jgi:hypothetical protein
MPRPVLAFGRAGSAALLQAGMGWTDDGVAYDLTALTDRVAPAGAGGECLFYTLYLTTRRFGPARLRVTVLVDELPLPEEVIVLAGAAAAQGTVDVTEIALRIPYLRDGVEVAKITPRGTWVRVLVQTDVAVTPHAGLDVTDVEIETEVVRESRSSIP